MPTTPDDTSREAREPVLSTLNADGSRRWLRPRLARGRFLTARRIVAYALLVLFTIVPHLRIGGEPVLLLEVVQREFTILGRTFLPTDTVLMALLMVSIFVTIFLVTALFGRVWCGWACPQTVYMEFVFRPIERLVEGRHWTRGTAPPARRILKFAIFGVLALFLAHTFLAYFVAPSTLWAWMQRSPLEHPTAFLVVAATTCLMLLDFGFLREQVCLVMCPYGRLQSALLDRHSLIITYDESRGEPRGPLRRARAAAPADVALNVVDPPRGDCIDCHMCVTTCPTGIDIRKGLQMECIGCAQCIDACDRVMDKVGKPRGLIRYSSQAVMAGTAARLVRPRTIIYPTVLVVLVAILAVLLGGRRLAEAQVLPRPPGAAAFAILEETGDIANPVVLRLTNRGEERATYTLGVSDGASLRPEVPEQTLEPGRSERVTFQIVAPAEVFRERGAHEFGITVRGTDGFERTLRYRMLGPRGARP